jgi:hypothetical protein
MYKPDFPYLGNQAIISSGRVVIHSKDDFIFLFGKKGVSISSPATFTVDANERTIIASSKIELGYQAEVNGNPVFLGTKTSKKLAEVLDALANFSAAIANLSAGETETAIANILYTATILNDAATRVSSSLIPECLSKTTYTN